MWEKSGNGRVNFTHRKVRGEPLVQCWDVTSHKPCHSYCSQRKVPCHYCSLMVKASELDEHQEYCGTRTEVCETCHRCIMYKGSSQYFSSSCALLSVFMTVFSARPPAAYWNQLQISTNGSQCLFTWCLSFTEDSLSLIVPWSWWVVGQINNSEGRPLFGDNYERAGESLQKREN